MSPLFVGAGAPGPASSARRCFWSGRPARVAGALVAAVRHREDQVGRSRPLLTTAARRRGSRMAGAWVAGSVPACDDLLPGGRAAFVMPATGQGAGPAGWVREGWDPRSGRSERLTRGRCAVGSQADLCACRIPPVLRWPPPWRTRCGRSGRRTGAARPRSCPRNVRRRLFSAAGHPGGAPAGFASRSKKAVPGRPPLRSGPLGAGRSPPASRPPSGRDGRGPEPRE